MAHTTDMVLQHIRCFIYAQVSLKPPKYFDTIQRDVYLRRAYEA